jgi:hypothetical protein
MILSVCLCLLHSLPACVDCSKAGLPSPAFEARACLPTLFDKHDFTETLILRLAASYSTSH